MEEARIEKSLKLFVVLSRASKVIMESANGVFEAHGLNPTEFAVLELLYHKGPQPIQKIGQKILLQSGSMTYVINQLEKKQLLRRERCPEDRRVIHINITEEGHALIEKIFPEHERQLAELMNELSDEEMDTLIHLTKKLGLSIRQL